MEFQLRNLAPSNINLVKQLSVGESNYQLTLGADHFKSHGFM